MHVLEAQLAAVQLHDGQHAGQAQAIAFAVRFGAVKAGAHLLARLRVHAGADRKSTRLNSSHVRISYAVFCLKKKKNTTAGFITLSLYDGQEADTSLRPS